MSISFARMKRRGSEGGSDNSHAVTDQLIAVGLDEGGKGWEGTGAESRILLH